MVDLGLEAEGRRFERVFVGKAEVEGKGAALNESRISDCRKACLVCA